MFKQGCMYPKCRKNGVLTYALVPLCEKHYIEISDETHRFYARILSKEERKHYQKIDYLIPWRYKPGEDKP